MAGKLPKSYSALCAAFLCACMFAANAQTLIDKIDAIRQTDALIADIENTADLHDLTYEYEARENKNKPLLSYTVNLKQNADSKTVKAVIHETGDGWQYIYTAWFSDGKAAAISELYKKYNGITKSWDERFVRTFYFSDDRVFAAEYKDEKPRLILEEKQLNKERAAKIMQIVQKSLHRQQPFPRQSAGTGKL